MNKSQTLTPDESAGEWRQVWVYPPKRILLVDDEICVAEFNAMMLTRAGYEVVVAHDGAEAWTALNDNRYDLMITDNKMPKLTGIELLGKLWTACIKLPVIMATGALLEDEFARSSWLQPDATLLKPFTIGELLHAVELVLDEANDDGGDERLFIHRHKKENTIAPAAAPRPDPTNSSRHILVVDDDSDLRQLIVEVLVGSGYKVEAVKDGAAGWEALQARSYDLVITDNKMPRLTGIEMIEKVRGAFMPLPVIMATRHIPSLEFDRRPWLKPNAALERPFTNDALLEAVANALNPTASRERITPPPDQ